MFNADVTLSAVAKQYYMNFNPRGSSDYHIDEALLSLDSASHNKPLHSNRPASMISVANAEEAAVETVVHLILYDHHLSSNLLIDALPSGPVTSRKSLDESNASGNNDTTQQKLHNKAQALIRNALRLVRNRLLRVRSKLFLFFVQSRLRRSCCTCSHNHPLVVQRNGRPGFAFQA